MRNMRKDSKKVESLDDLAGCDELRDEDKAALQQMITDFWNASGLCNSWEMQANRFSLPSTQRAAECTPSPESLPFGRAYLRVRACLAQ